MQSSGENSHIDTHSRQAGEEVKVIKHTLTNIRRCQYWQNQNPKGLPQEQDCDKNKYLAEIKEDQTVCNYMAR